MFRHDLSFSRITLDFTGVQLDLGCDTLSVMELGVMQITMVFYLNKDWTPKVGGKLRIYEGKDLDSKYVDVEPLGNRLVVFWSDSVLHEVSM